MSIVFLYESKRLVNMVDNNYRLQSLIIFLILNRYQPNKKKDFVTLNFLKLFW